MAMLTRLLLPVNGEPVSGTADALPTLIVLLMDCADPNASPNRSRRNELPITKTSPMTWCTAAPA